MIQLNNIYKTYYSKGIRKPIFQGLNFEFNMDRNYALLGQNGVGKSTLLRLIAGGEMPDTGKIIRKGKVSWPMGFSGGFNGNMTGIENIRFVARIYGKDPKKIIEYVNDFSELGDSISLPIKTYSSGMRARLAFGLSLAIDFDCYLSRSSMDRTSVSGAEDGSSNLFGSTIIICYTFLAFGYLL